MHFRKQAKISTVFNLSNIKLSATQSSLLEKCLFFCPTHKLDLVELCNDINENASLLKVLGGPKRRIFFIKSLELKCHVHIF